MTSHDRNSGRQWPGASGASDTHAAPRRAVAPGKMTRTSYLPSRPAGTLPGGAQRESMTPGGAASSRARSSAEWTDDPLMLRAFGFHGEDSTAAASQVPAVGGTRIERTEIPTAPAVQRRSLPGAAPAGPAPTGVEESGDDAADRAARQATHEQAADQVETLLSRPDPVAGVGTPQDALRVLAALPMGELLGTLDILEQHGRLSEILPYVDAGDADAAGRVRAALDARDLARMSPGEAQGALLDALAATLERMPADEQNGVYRYLIARRQPSRDLEMLLEGILAMQSAAVDQREPMPAAAGPLAAPGTPAPIGPGPFAPPGKQPVPLYIGNDAHKAIADHYQRLHRGEIVRSNSVPISTLLEILEAQGHQVDRSSLTEQELDRRPDILNVTRLCLYEIKPESAAGAGQGQAAMYISILAKAGVAVSLGPSNDPGTSGQLPAPGGVFLFQSVRPGVIEYQYRHGHLVPVPIPLARPGHQEAPERTWRWELQPLSPAQQSALATATLGTALLILMAILLAPAGI